MNVDLLAYRCPNAQLFLNQLLPSFIESGEAELRISSIEPSLERSLRQRVAHLDLNVEIDAAVTEVPITDEHRDAWSADFDEEDYGDVSVIRTFAIRRTDVIVLELK